ncbi:MAG TPA: hypothetical protein P5069_13645, partial [Candidatus Hydrogenedentes bacterium]|nr:hypothetical protein [Candidatus Hydrogenedentota bacterium]
PAEPLNERERVRPQDLFPAGAVQEYLSDAFGIEPARVPQVPADVYGVQSGPVDENITAVDPWWTAITNASGQVQNRLLSYAAAGAEAIRITEIMPRPVRRVEAEILPLNDQINVPPKDQIHYQVDPSIKTPAGTATWTVANMPYFNLNPAPYTEMPLFDMDRVAAMAAPEWKLRTYYQEVDGTGAIVSEQPVLGAQTGYRYTVPAGTVWSPVENDPANVNPDVLEFHFRATDGLPAGRYYLTLNVTDPVTGAMTVDNINQLEYAIRYTTAASGAEGVASNIARIVNIPDAYDVDGDGLDDDLTIERAQLLADYCAKYFQTVDEPEFLAAGAGAPPGWVFLPSRALEDPAPLNPSDYAAIEQYFVILNGSDPTVPTLATLLTDQHTGAFLDTVVAGDTPNTRTLTVIIPPAGTAYDTLCVAVRLKPIEANLVFRDPATGLPILDPVSGAPIPRHLSVNFFDFSQEPDHEYVEIANTTDQELDLSGWTLEVGIPDPAGLDTNPEMRDPFKSVWRVPANTRIAAKGRLLLTFTDKSTREPLTEKRLDYKTPPIDIYSNASLPSNIDSLETNGIGLGALLGTDTELVTVPPIADVSWDAAYAPLTDADGTGSVFTRAATDYIDNDGDGVSSQARYLTNTNIEDTDHVLEEIRTHGDASGVVPAFSRIVPLVNERLWEDAAYTDAALPVSLAEINSVKRVAQLVLRGGVLPNYPERDGYDNDGDGGYIAKDSTAAYPSADGAILRRYIRGALDKDMVDNDYNALVDENGAEWLNGAAWEHANPYLSEGVDEGGNPVYHDGYRPRVYGPGSFETGPDTPFRIAFLPDVTDYAVFLSSVDSGLPAVRNGVSDLTSYIYPAIPGVAPADSPEWAAFVERRWNPGDNVIVTLYVGDSAYGRVADQATYREYDVVNRTVDDIVESPYYVDGFNNYAVDPVSGGVVWLGAEGGTPIDNFRNRVALFPDRRSHWLPDQMGLDFYRALERKHPLYAGDRFGTSNRWEPTDGAYDDWADSPGWYEQVY